MYVLLNDKEMGLDAIKTLFNYNYSIKFDYSNWRVYPYEHVGNSICINSPNRFTL